MDVGLAVVPGFLATALGLPGIATAQDAGFDPGFSGGLGMPAFCRAIVPPLIRNFVTISPSNSAVVR